MSETANPQGEIQNPKSRVQDPAADTQDAVSLTDRRLVASAGPSVSAGPQTLGRNPPPRPRPLILVADDEPDVVFVIKTRIRLSGYDVVEAMDGAVALERIQELRPDLVLLDLKMPKLDGYELCKTVKADPILRGTLILVCSATSSLGLSPEARCLQLGADGYIRKPYDVKKLLQEIARLLALKKESAAVGS